MSRPRPARGGRRGAGPTRGNGRERSRPPAATESTPSQRIEVVYAPGLDDVVREELVERLGRLRSLRQVPGREDSLSFDYTASWGALLKLRTIVAPYAVLDFAVPRPGSLVSGEHLARLVHALRVVRRINRDDPPGSFRFEAAGRDSSAFQRLAGALAGASGLRHEPEDGDVALRFRRAARGREGWEVLVRLSTRPLSHRGWRVRNMPGAVNGPIARAVARLTGPRPTDRVANLMCGSGTLLIERLLAAPARRAVGVDADAEAIAACAENLAAAGLEGSARLLVEDVRGPGWQELGPFDVILADPPWGTLIGSHDENEALHLALLERAHAVAARDARLAVLTHEIRQMERCLAAARGLWEPVSVTRVFQKGHHPRVYLLRRAR